MFLVFICIIKLTVCYITKFQVFFISLHFSYMPVPLFFQSLSPISQFLRAPFLQKTIYYLLVHKYIRWRQYCTSFLHILLF